MSLQLIQCIVFISRGVDASLFQLSDVKNALISLFAEEKNRPCTNWIKHADVSFLVQFAVPFIAAMNHWSSHLNSSSVTASLILSSPETR